MRYAVVIEKGERNYSAYIPDLPGCVSVGDTLKEVKAEIREAIEFHLEGVREDGLPIPRASSGGPEPRGAVLAPRGRCSAMRQGPRREPSWRT